MFLGRLMAGGRREEGPDLRAASHEHLQLVDEITATLSKLQESARNQFIKVNVGGYRWYHDDTYSFPPGETGQFRNSRGVPRIENWRLSDLVTLKEALDQECISVECKRKRRIDENEPAIESTEKEKGRPKHALSSSTPTEDGMAKLLHERDSLQKMLANANKDISALRLSLANSEAERETVKHQLWMMEARTPKDERTSPAGPVKTDAATQESHFSEMDAAYEKWKTAGALEYGFLSRILKNDYELLVAAGRFFEGPEDTSARQGYDSPQNGRSSMQGQYSESEAEFSRSDKPFFSRSKSSKKSDVEKEISAADVTFIITCLQNTSGGSLSIDIPAVAKALLYTNPKSVTNKIAFMRKKYDIPITGARPKPEESFPPRRTSLLPSKGTPGPKPKSRPSNGYLQTPTNPSDNVGTYHQWQPETEIVVAPPTATPILSTENPVTEWRPPVVDDQKPQSRTPLPSMVPDDGTSIRVQARTPFPSAIRTTEQSIQVLPGPRAHEEDLIQPKVESRAASPAVKRGFVAVNGNYGDNPNKKPHVEPTNGHGEKLT